MYYVSETSHMRATSRYVLLFHPYIFSVNKWNRFQDTSRLQKKLVWLSCGGGGGARGAYVAHGLLLRQTSQPLQKS